MKVIDVYVPLVTFIVKKQGEALMTPILQMETLAVPPVGAFIEITREVGDNNADVARKIVQHFRVANHLWYYREGRNEVAVDVHIVPAKPKRVDNEEEPKTVPLLNIFNGDDE